jgi:hypothetical protein
MMSLGRGSIIGMSKKQKLNTKSSTECELVGVNDASPQMLWTRYFIEGQGYNVEASILNQDNLSAIMLKNNRRASIRKRTKHINVRYFFIKDRIASGEITVKHCPATDMLADHFTKPLQGKNFRAFRTEIQGIPVELNKDIVAYTSRLQIKKRKAEPICPTPSEHPEKKQRVVMDKTIIHNGTSIERAITPPVHLDEQYPHFPLLVPPHIIHVRAATQDPSDFASSLLTYVKDL